MLPLPAAGPQSVERAGEPRAASEFALDEPSQGALAVALELGSDRVLCARFGGRIDADLGRASGRRGRFRAAGAAAPGWCSLR